MSASSQYYKVTSRVGVPHRHEVEVTIPLLGPAGPAGPAGTGLETLQVQGDTLYRGAATGERLPIGTAGQVMRVNANGTAPSWSNSTDAGAVPVILITQDWPTFTAPAPTRHGASQGKARIFVSRISGPNLTITLQTADVQDGDIVEIYNLFQQGGLKTTISTGGFGTFDLYPRQSASFAYQANMGPPRWAKTYDNNFSTTLPNGPGDSLGVIGDMAASDTHFYVKVPTNVTPGGSAWRRVPWAIWNA